LLGGKANGFTERKNYVLNLLENMRGKTILKTSSHPSRMKYDGFIQPFNKTEKNMAALPPTKPILIS